MIDSLKQFEIYISAIATAGNFYTCHNHLVFKHRMKKKNRRFLAWYLLLQELGMEIKHIAGMGYVTLSRAQTL